VDDQTKKLIEGIFRGYNEGGPAAFIEGLKSIDALSPDFAMEIQEDLPNGGEWRGVEGFEAMAQLWLEAWESFEVLPGEPEEVGPGRYLVPVRQHVVARATGIELDEPFVYTLEFRDERLRRVGLFKDRPRAERALSGAR
jgi:hypothetical protein